MIGDFDGAMFDYNQAIAIRPNYAEAYLNRGMLHYSLGEQMKASLVVQKTQLSLNMRQG